MKSKEASQEEGQMTPKTAVAHMTAESGWPADNHNLLYCPSTIKVEIILPGPRTCQVSPYFAI